MHCKIWNNEDTPVKDQNCTPVEELVLGPDVNNNQYPEPLHVVLWEIANAFKEATVGTATAARPALRENNLVCVDSFHGTEDEDPLEYIEAFERAADANN
ncbi:hypothetical protein C2G38_2214163 [Gigaspora rosea]|uniref:Uncharacterized protein n=1 Tax=Gigaspora rosea TaxID=44941 RepID=A0A397UED6_9GLOM|nr:hypothetical protein C2G38_2214163 [Gigaspora rosea]